MYDSLFSKRHSVKPITDELIYENIPTRTRIGFYNLLIEFNRLEYFSTELDIPYQEICQYLRIKIKGYLLEGKTLYQGIEKTINKCEWYEFLDICEVFLYYTLPEMRSEYRSSINSFFEEDGLGYRITDHNEVERIGIPFIDSKIKKARCLLKESEFKGADKHFEKALKALNTRPNPDIENCVKDAICAIESVGRVITANNKALLDRIILDLTKKDIIPKHLGQVFKTIYFYRGDEPGVAHGAADISKMSIEEAEFILATSAAAILYLASKRGQIASKT